MRRVASIRINNDLAAGDAGVALRASSDKPARRIDVILRVFVEQLRRHGVLDDLFLNLRAQLLVRDVIRVLRRDNNSVHAERSTITVFNCYLRFSVRTKIRQLT